MSRKTESLMALLGAAMWGDLPYKVSEEVFASKTVSIVVVRYTEKFDHYRSSGLFVVWEITEKEEDAVALAEEIAQGTLPRPLGHYFPWEHHATVEGVEVHTFRVRDLADQAVVANVTIHRH